jgi:hypothetical protein
MVLSVRRLNRQGVVNESFTPQWFPPARVCHPYPLVRLGVLTHGGSQMRTARPDLSPGALLWNGSYAIMIATPPSLRPEHKIPH